MQIGCQATGGGRLFRQLSLIPAVAQGDMIPRSTVLCRLLLGCILLIPAFGAAAEDWPMWRGPRNDGRSSETGIPLHWDATQNIAWKIPIPGRGHSSPIVFGDRIFLTTCIEAEQRRLLLCLDRRDGHTLWQRDVLIAPLEKKHNLNNFASATPATDGKHVWVTFLAFPIVHIYCYDIDGNPIWDKSPGQFRSQHGWSAAPILYDDKVIVNCDQDAVAYIVALDRITGEERWRIDRPNRTRSYCNPIIADTPDGHGGTRRQMVLTGSKSVASYDPDSGRQWWVLDGPTEQFVASPVYTDGVFFITGGFPTFHMMGIDSGGSGNITDTPHVLWHDPHSGAYVPSAVGDGKYVFVVSDEGQATCLEARTGKRLWSQRIGKHYRPSAVWAEGRVYFLGDDGEMTVVKSSPAYEALAKNALEEDCFASPAISRGQMFIRAVGHLYCIGKGKG
jgi:outer membrane protein assembly factor BamB